MRHSSRGFTLIELTIALVLLALLSSVLYGWEWICRHRATPASKSR